MGSIQVDADVIGDSPDLAALRAQLIVHPLYSAVQTRESLRIFMREHVFAVWDFMSLLKRLQQLVTCCQVPWLPASDGSLARFINEIVLAEESDINGRGGHCSHFELYLSAMDEIGADTNPIRGFIAKLQQGEPVEQALLETPILPTTREFVRSTLRLAKSGQPHEVAAAFFYGREDVIPDMFSRLVAAWPAQGVQVERMTHYLQRHIELDANDHGPLASRLVETLCDNQRAKRREVTLAAATAISQRMQLWQGILDAIQAE